MEDKDLDFCCPNMPCSGAQSNWWESDSKQMDVINPGNKLLGGPEK